MQDSAVVEETKQDMVTDEREMDAEEIELAKKLKEWVNGQLDNEVARVGSCGQKILRLPVKNCSVLRPGDATVINRVEIDSALDFDTVQQILLSEPMPIP